MSTTAQVTAEVITKTPEHLPYFELLVFALGLTAITFIAIILYLDHKEKAEPVHLPEKTR